MRHLSELLAVEELWPDVPHQVCQFHVLRDASKTAFEADKQVKTAMRKRLQPKVREVRKQIKKHLATASPPEAQQLAVLDEYATGIVTAASHRWPPALQVRHAGRKRDVR
jgi:hypothetical protein